MISPDFCSEQRRAAGAEALDCGGSTPLCGGRGLTRAVGVGAWPRRLLRTTAVEPAPPQSGVQPPHSTTLLALFFSLVSLLAPAVAQDSPRYEKRAEHDPNGIGLFYMGREIAHVMGHQAAGWLERPEREEEERTDLLIEALKLQPGQVAADIGAGTGYIAERMARKVGEKGLVYAEDIQQEMLDLLQRKLRLKSIANVKPLLGTLTDPKLPEAGVDLIIMVDVYHELDHPYEMTESMIRGLKPGGRLVFVEFRKEDPNVPIKEVHKMSEAQVKKEMAAFPTLEWVETIGVLPQQHIIIFRRK